MKSPTRQPRETIFLSLVEMIDLFTRMDKNKKVMSYEELKAHFLSSLSMEINTKCNNLAYFEILHFNPWFIEAKDHDIAIAKRRYALWSFFEKYGIKGYRSYIKEFNKQKRIYEKENILYDKGFERDNTAQTKENGIRYKTTKKDKEKAREINMRRKKELKRGKFKVVNLKKLIQENNLLPIT